MKYVIFCITLLVATSTLTACGLIDRIKGNRAATAATENPQPPVSNQEGIGPEAGAKSADALDKSTAAEVAAAKTTAASTSERSLGKVVVALGSPTEQGFWLKSTLVTSLTQGRVVAATGQSVAVELQPGAGAALLSLAAFRALEISLTDLPELQVFAN